MSVAAWWVCGHPEAHYFQYGQLGWHLEEWANQGLDEGHPVPEFCQAELDDGSESCMDSSHLYGPFDEEGIAKFYSEARRLVNGLDTRDPESRRYLAATLARSRVESKEELDTLLTARAMAAIGRTDDVWHGKNSLVHSGGLLDPEVVHGLERFFR